ncbi:MAG: MurT ligase domain-containing protein [Lachnospiraceae bacterium]
MRLIIAIWAGKLISFLSKLTGGKSTSAPGLFAMKICKDIIWQLSKKVKKGIIVTCGTNGKTTTNNLLCSALEAKGYKVVCNRAGANMTSGIATIFLQEASLFGKLDADYACLEVDEAYTVHVFDLLKPDMMIITNLFRDQLDRYGEIDITTQLLKKAIAKTSNLKLILNGDDPLCAQFGFMEDVTPYYFGVSEQVLPQVDDMKEGRFCPLCGAEQEYDYYHYSQLGQYRCTKCDFKHPQLQYSVTDVSLHPLLKFSINGQPMEIHYKGFYNIYNLTAVYAALDLLGLSTEHFGDLLSNYKPQIGRMQEFDLGKPVILSLSKNPAGFNQAISTVNADTRKKDVIITINDNANDGRDVSWIWDVDFHKIYNDSLNTLTVTGIRMYDAALRFKYENISVANVTDDMKSAIQSCLSTDSEIVYLLVNYSALYSTETILQELEEEYHAGK